MKQQVNYIAHHKAVNIKMMEDDLSSTHISLYNALFLIWNECGFETELSINRNDVMKLSKIGSANTYTTALKELDKKGYLKYLPSHNPLIGSKINLYRFDKSTDNTTDNSSVKSSSKGTDNSTDTLSKQLNYETIKLINNNIDLINEKLKSWLSKESKNTKFKKPDLEEISIYLQAYCLSKDLSFRDFENESEKFYNYYTANGWKVGRNPMKDWQSALRNWLSNSKQYQNNGKSSKTIDTNNPYSIFER